MKKQKRRRNVIYLNVKKFKRNVKTLSLSCCDIIFAFRMRTFFYLFLFIFNGLSALANIHNIANYECKAILHKIIINKAPVFSGEKTNHKSDKLRNKDIIIDVCFEDSDDNDINEYHIEKDTLNSALTKNQYFYLFFSKFNSYSSKNLFKNYSLYIFTSTLRL